MKQEVKDFQDMNNEFKEKKLMLRREKKGKDRKKKKE